MRHFHPRSTLSLVRLLLPALPCVLIIPARCQDSGGEGTTLRGNRAEIAVTVRDSSGEPISFPALVKLLRGGGMPVDRAPHPRAARSSSCRFSATTHS